MNKSTRLKSKHCRVRSNDADEAVRNGPRKPHSTNHGFDALAFEELVAAARDKSRVSGFTHNFYRYPARFSPKFVRSAIEQFTRPGDLVFDPFMGGGTTLVEAIASGRHSIGTDISSLATFVSEAKTQILSQSELDRLHAWAGRLTSKINIRLPSVSATRYVDAGYYKHLDSLPTWRLRKAVEQALATAVALRSSRLEKFARCVVLRTAQWALDGRKHIPSVGQFRLMMHSYAIEMLRGAEELKRAVHSSAARQATAHCIHTSIIGANLKQSLAGRAPRLVLTSPPYPGVHVLYHRWQVDGRKETAAPFWIANKLDGSGAAYYTLGGRHAADNWTYFEGLESALASVVEICDAKTLVVQVVAFAEPTWQLPRFLEAAESAGLTEARTPIVAGHSDGRLWRTIPNRKWHADQLGAIPASQEVVLFHRKKK